MDGFDRGAGQYSFGAFRLDPVSRALFQDGARLHLPARLFDTLHYLVQHHDRLVEREELRRAVWPSHAVADGNLGRAISSLRLALKSTGEDSIIVTAPGRGYRFGMAVTWEAALHEPGAAASASPFRRPAFPRLAAIPVLVTILVTILVAALAAAWALHPWSPQRAAAEAAGAPPPPHSIAVLPFRNLGSDPADTLLSDGISQELINSLGRVSGVKIAASTSSFLFKDKRTPIRDIARQLNVGAVLEGSLQRAGSRLHITVDLVDSANGFQLWSHIYDTQQNAMLPMQSEIARGVIASLKAVLLGRDAARLTLGETTNPAAFDSYLRGMTEISAMDPGANRQAIGDFNHAIDLDPSYALAFAARARALSFIVAYGNSPDVDYSHRMGEAALEDAQHAVALTPDLGAAHAELGRVLQVTMTDLGKAEAEFETAVALAPGDATILSNYGMLQLQLGHIQAGLDAAERGASLDPLAPSSYGRIALMLAYARRYDDGMEALRREHVLRPNDALFQRTYVGLADTLRGDDVAAKRVCGGDVDYHDMLCLAVADHALGLDADAEAELAKARAVLGDNGAYFYARTYAQWGDQKNALMWLQTAYRLRDPGLMELIVDPGLDSIRTTPTYLDIVRKLGFPAP